MSTKILKKLKGIACAIAAGILAFSAFYSITISRAKEVPLRKSFYFLVSKDSRVEVSTEFTRLDGGAGYLLETEGERYVVLSVYLNEEDGRAVQENLGGEFSTELLHKGVNSLYFKGKDKKKSALYINALRTLEGCVTVLEECISRLEKGATQESCKRILSILQRQFAFAEREYEDYPAFSISCRQWAEELAKLGEDTVYGKDLRFLLCWQVERYLELCKEFSL